MVFSGSGSLFVIVFVARGSVWGTVGSAFSGTGGTGGISAVAESDTGGTEGMSLSGGSGAFCGGC